MINEKSDVITASFNLHGRREIQSTGFKDLHLKMAQAKARIWP